MKALYLGAALLFLSASSVEEAREAQAAAASPPKTLLDEKEDPAVTAAVAEFEARAFARVCQGIVSRRPYASELSAEARGTEVADCVALIRG